MKRWGVIWKCECTAYVSIEAETAEAAQEIAERKHYYEADLHRIGRTIPVVVKQVTSMDEDIHPTVGLK